METILVNTQRQAYNQMILKQTIMEYLTQNSSSLFQSALRMSLKRAFLNPILPIYYSYYYSGLYNEVHQSILYIFIDKNTCQPAHIFKVQSLKIRIRIGIHI
ncbi:unnamed protein product [Paramecium sonneborni]|uniref:Uncharacterized protein n=1 Tax=Paramecium sonneborni TaxID=65129 RepID=A0A8S1RQC0_9CILI|nr:unnamed protein product [Paramecium sonneborni]